uniref:PDZ domain-containing protein n=1 Tax=Haptolina brevifila TaxID=156173 RepID=A0A7S2NH64_9EUKA
MPGFSTKIETPYAVTDIWRELFLADVPLGTPPNTVVELDPMARTFLCGRAEGKPGTAFARRTLSWPAGAAPPALPTAEANKDRLVYNLLECQAARFAKWEIMEQRTSDELVLNGANGKPPSVTFELTPLGFNGLRSGSTTGSEVKITFEYASVTKRSDGWWFAADKSVELEKRFEGVGSAWAATMRKRGYQPELVPRLDLAMKISRPPQVQVPTHWDDASQRSTTASEASANSPAQMARQSTRRSHPMMSQLTERQMTERNAAGRSTSGPKLTARSKPFWQLEQERKEKQRRETQQQEEVGSSLPRHSTQPPTVRYGLRTVKVEALGALGITLQEPQKKRWRGSNHLAVMQVIPGSLADRLGVPIGCILTGINGRPLAPGIPHKQQLLSALDSGVRPLFLSFYVEPPKDASRPSVRRAMIRLISGKPYRHAATRQAADIAKEKPKLPSETPTTTDRSESSSETEAYIDNIEDEMSA